VQLFNLFGAHEFMPTSQAASDLFGEVCAATPLACASIITAICGFNSDNMNLTRLPIMVQYAPSGAFGCCFAACTQRCVCLLPTAFAVCTQLCV